MTNIHAKESFKNFLLGVKATVTPESVRVLRRGYTKKNFVSDLMSGLIVANIHIIFENEIGINT